MHPYINRPRYYWMNRHNALYLLGTLCLLGALLLNAIWPSPAGAHPTSATPVPTCPAGYVQTKFEAPTGSRTQGAITLSVTRSEEGEPKEVRFQIVEGLVHIVYVKASTGYNTYDFLPEGATSGAGLVAPSRADGSTYGISHVTFCSSPAVESTPTAGAPGATSTLPPPAATEVVAPVTPEETASAPTATPSATVSAPTAILGDETATATPSEAAAEATATSTEVVAEVTATATVASAEATGTATTLPAEPTEGDSVEATRTPTGVVGGVVATRTSTAQHWQPTATPTEGDGVGTTRTATTSVEQVASTPASPSDPTATAPATTAVPTSVAGPPATPQAGLPPVVAVPALPALSMSPTDPATVDAPRSLPVTSTATGYDPAIRVLLTLGLVVLGLGLLLRGYNMAEKHVFR